MSGFFRLQSSSIFSGFLFFGYTLAIMAVLMLPVEALVKIALTVLLGMALLYYLCRDAWLLLPSSPVAMNIAGEDITLQTREGSELPGRISGDSVITPFLAIVNILPQAQRSRRHVVIFPDSMDKEQFRELRVLLKWGI